MASSNFVPCEKESRPTEAAAKGSAFFAALSMVVNSLEVRARRLWTTGTAKLIDSFKDISELLSI